MTTHSLNEDLIHSVLEEANLSSKQEQVVLDELTKYEDVNNWQEINLIYYGEPKAQARPRINTTLNFFYDPSKSIKQVVMEQIVQQLPKNFKPVSNEIKVSAIFYRSITKSTSKINRVLMEMKIFPFLKKPDVDNYVKLFLDSLNGILYTDDSVITSLHIEKYYSCKPRVEINIKYRK